MKIIEIVHFTLYLHRKNALSLEVSLMVFFKVGNKSFILTLILHKKYAMTFSLNVCVYIYI